MELKLKGYGTIEITNATLVDGGDILIETSGNFCEIAKTTEYEIVNAHLVEADEYWYLVIQLNLPEFSWCDDDNIVIPVENQEDVYRLNARL